MKVRLRSHLARLVIDRRLVKIYIASFISYMSNGYSVTMVYPFLSATTKFFLPDADTASVNTYAGFIVAAFFAGRIFGSFIWGSLADHYGRKRILVASTSLMSMCTLVLAFSVNYTMVVIFRVLLGLSNGVMTVLRAVISESSTDTNQAFGFSVLTCSWLMAALVSPLLSGLTADPISQYNLTLPDGATKSFLTQFPYSLPYLLNTFVCVAGSLAIIFLLPETLNKKSKKEQSSSIGEQINGDSHQLQLTSLQDDHPPLDDDVSIQDSIARNENENENGLHLVGVARNSDSDTKFELKAKQPLAKFRSTVVTWVLNDMKPWLENFKSILCNKVTLMIFTGHCLFAVIDTGGDALSALWSATPLSLGGLAFKVSEIGFTNTLIAAISWPFNLFTYPLLSRRFGSLQSHQMSSVVFLFLLVLIPNIHHLAVLGQIAAVWVFLILCRVITTTAACTCFSTQCVFISNSVTSDQLGRINGMAVLISDIFRTLSPALTGALYAASLSSQSMAFGFPLDYHLTFVIFAGIALTLIIIMSCLPPSINKKKQ